MDRLRQAIGRNTVAEFARRSQLAHSTLRAYLEGESLPGWESAVRIAQTAGRSLDWFTRADDVVTYAQEIDRELVVYGETAMRRPLEDFALIPLYDVRASAGHGAWNSDERISKMLAFRRDWIRFAIGSNPDDLALIYIDGDSMEPTVADGDVVMVDRSQLEVRSDDIFVFTQDGQLLVKRLQRLGAGALRVLSDNPRFPPYEIAASDFSGDRSTNQIVGRVVWAGVRL